ncbi:MAG: hypothetical protein ACP5CD_05555 [Thermovirgaceae bacterium]
MNKKILVLSAFLAAILVFVGGATNLEAYTASVDELGFWPLWPKPETTSNVFQPPSFQSIGREYAVWVEFENPVSGTYQYTTSFWKANLYVRALALDEEDVDGDGRTDDYLFPLMSTTYGSEVFHKYFVSSALLYTFPDVLSDLSDEFRAYSTLKGYDAEWLTIYNDAGDTIIGGPYANQAFQAWFNYSRWKTFLHGYGDADFELADSGHAPPLIAWEEDSWVTGFIDLTKESVPEDWEDRTFVFLPTNQGILNMYEIDQVDKDSVDRLWTVMPQPAFRQAVYHEAQYTQNSAFERFTLLDGPVYVRDVQEPVSGEGETGAWRRILVGTTGLGTKQQNKPSDAWEKEIPDETEDLTTLGDEVSPPAEPDSSRNFGIYAMDISDPGSPIPLWAVSNIGYKRSSDVNETTVPESLAASVSDYNDLEYSLTKPLIGFTQSGDESTRQWHILLLGINTNDEYCWYDVDPLTGSLKSTGSSGVFANNSVPETVPTKSDGTWGLMDLEGEWSYEDIFPSRILSVYPKSKGLPVLSDVYAYLSNGTLYRWNVNAETEETYTPERLLWVYSGQEKRPAPCLTDFDVAYIDYDGDGVLNTLMSVVIGFDQSSWESGQDTIGLLIVDLDENISSIDLQSLAWGQTGDVLENLNKNEGKGMAGIQLDYQPAQGPSQKFKSVVGSPIFLDNWLYFAVYDPGGDDPDKEPKISRLYYVDLSSTLDGDKKVPLDEYFADYPDVEIASIIVDSEGYLHIFDAEGQHPQGFEPIKVLDYDREERETDPDPSPVKVISWRTRTASTD